MKRKRNSYLWVAVENNEYELPVFIEESAANLAIRMGISRSAVNHRVEGNNEQIKSKYKIIKVAV